MKLRGAIKDLHRLYSSDFKEVNTVTSILKDDDSTITDLYRRATKESRLKAFIKKYPEVFYYLPTVLDQPKSKGCHACALIVAPVEKHIKNWTPVYKNKDGLLLTEFEGTEMDESGFLKQDVLATKQLSKFKDIVDLSISNNKEVPNIYKLPDDDSEVYRYYSNGWNSDVFQSKSDEFKAFTRKLKPESMTDLIACMALVRPGPMRNGYHTSYTNRRHGEEDVSYIWGTEEILSETYALMVYQEQIMKICSSIGGINSVDSLKVLKALGKKKLDVLLPFKEQFIEGATEKGCPKQEAVDMWSAMEEFAAYGFNKSHSAGYGEVSYISQWLKVHYPVEFWMTALKWAKDEDVPKYLSEIRRAGVIEVKPVDINMSLDSMSMNDDTKTITWGMSSIKYIGEKAAEQIMNLRPSSGYESFDQFIELNYFKGSSVNKRVYEGLILAGAFDSLENVNLVQKRANLLNKYWGKCKVKLDENKSWYHKNSHIVKYDWCWLKEQKRLTGLAFFNYKQLCLDELDESKYITNDMMLEPTDSLNGCMGGVIIDAIEKNSTRGKFAKITFESNYEIFNCMVWSDVWEYIEYSAKELVGKIILVSGNVNFEPKYSQANQMTASSLEKIIFL